MGDKDKGDCSVSSWAHFPAGELGKTPSLGGRRASHLPGNTQGHFVVCPVVVRVKSSTWKRIAVLTRGWDWVPTSVAGRSKAKGRIPSSER